MEQGARKLIFDLRYNPGGLVESAVNIASLFLAPGKVVFRAKARNKDLEKTVKTRENPVSDTATPLIILTNAFSASCSEILTGALQDHKRARVLEPFCAWSKFPAAEQSLMLFHTMSHPGEESSKRKGSCPISKCGSPRQMCSVFPPRPCVIPA